MYALKCSINGEVFTTTFNKDSLPILLKFQENSVVCGAITLNPNNENEVNIGGLGEDGSYALANGTLDYTFVPAGVELIPHSITIEFLPYETNGEILNSGDKDVYSLIDTGTLPKTITSCAFFNKPPFDPGA